MATVTLCLLASIATAQDSAVEVAAQIDESIAKELKATEPTPADRSTDEDFLRRVTRDIAGTLPAARQVTLFGLDPSRNICGGDEGQRLRGRAPPRGGDVLARLHQRRALVKINI